MARPQVYRIALASAVCVAAVATHLPHAQQPPMRFGPVAVTTRAVPINPENPSQREVGRFTYAGGLELTTAAGVRFGGLSDLDVDDKGRVLSVTDEGAWISTGLILDEGERLTGIAGVTSAPLAGLDGEPLRDKAAADAEGLASMPNGDRLVSFEREHRIWRYPSGGGRPVTVPTPPTADLPLNSGMEGLTSAPPLGDDVYLVGSEGGKVWLCRLTTACRETALGSFVPESFGLTALAVSPDGSVLALATRAFEPSRGVRVRVRLLPRTALDDSAAPPLDELILEAPLTRDNVEGLALRRGRNGGLRLYLLSDNNFSDTQHTYLLAFDWTAPSR